MNVLEAIFLGIIQGLTEFIPVSSSGHLVLAHKALGTSDNELVFDLALHVGTLLALLVFFNRELFVLARALFVKSKLTRLAWFLLLATCPAIVSGLLLQSAAESSFRSPKLVAATLLLAASFMLVAERFMQRRQKLTKLKDLNLRQTLVVGAAQALAVIPGISRSGSTITAGLLMGVDRVSATRFSFLLGIPITLGAILKVLFTREAFSTISSDTDIFLAGFIAAFVSGVLAIRFLLNFLAKHSLDVFAYYRIALGVAVLLLTLR